jgi:transcription elongation factor SPT5
MPDFMDGMDDEEIARRMEERYRRSSAYDENYDVEADDGNLLPSVRDPKLFSVPCRGGTEEQTVISIMQKAVNCAAKGQALKIKSAFFQPSIKGFVYVEAEKEDHARAAILGLRSLFHYKMKLVPIKEMVEVLTASRKSSTIKRNGWVRIKRGKYKGDLAQVVDPDESQSRALVRLVPRIDLHAITAKKQGASSQLKRKRGIIAAPQRLFNADEVQSAGGTVEKKFDSQTRVYYHMFEGEKYNNGFLIKYIKIDGLQRVLVTPTVV